MHLTHITNAPRELALGGAVYRARALTLADLGEVLAWLEDRLPADPDEPPVEPPRFSADVSRLALASTDGLAVVLHLALLACQPELTRDQARALAAGMTPEDEARLLAIAFRRRPSDGSPGEGPPAKDLAEVRWGAVFEALARHRAWAYPGVAGLTLDQYDNHVARGELREPDDLDLGDVQRMWQQARLDAPEVLP